MQYQHVEEYAMTPYNQMVISSYGICWLKNLAVVRSSWGESIRDAVVWVDNSLSRIFFFRDELTLSSPPRFDR